MNTTPNITAPVGRLLGTVEGCQVWRHDTGLVDFRARGRIDNDGGSNPEHDPDHDPDTSLHHYGRPIDSELVPGIVLPPEIIDAVPETVLGCQAWARFKNGEWIEAVVFDIGPRSKLGEMTPALARRLGIDPSPTHGGEDAPDVDYRFMPGLAAVVDDIEYTLQPHRKG